MGYPLRVLARLMTLAEFMDWSRAFAAEPFDDRRCFDLPAASIQATAVLIANPKSELTPRDLMPFEDPLSPEALTEKLMA